MDQVFEIRGRKFSMVKLDALKQFHIVRRVGPLIADLLKALGGIKKEQLEGLTEKEKLEEFAQIAEPVMEGLSKLSDKDAEFVLFRLLSAVQVHQAEHNVWAKIASDQGIMMQDLDLPTLLQVAGKSLVFNLSGFFSMLPRT